MTELDMITRLRPELPLPELASLGPARDRLLAAVAAELPASAPVPPATAPSATPGRLRRARWPVSWRLAVAGLATSMAAGATLLATSGGGATPALVPQQINAAAAHVLNLAAGAALRQPGAPPRPDQFIYHAIRDGGGHLYQSWLSVDGTRNGLVRGIGGGGWSYVPGCRHGRERVNASAPHGGTNGWQRCTPVPAYLPSMPTSPRAMGAYLERTQRVSLGDTVADLDLLGKTIADLLTSTYLTPRQLAALYDFMANTPGFTVVPGARDAVGRVGMGIRWPVSDGQAAAPGDTDMIIFNPHTGTYLGGRTTYQGESPATYSGDAVVKLAVVDRIGQLP
jgi:hypothetical protein